MYFTIRFMSFNIFLNNITLIKNTLRRNPKILNRVGKSFDPKFCIMKRNKIFSFAITLLVIAFFTTSWVSPVQAQKPALMPAVYGGVPAEAWEILTGVIFKQDRRRHNDDRDRNSEDREHDK